MLEIIIILSIIIGVGINYTYLTMFGQVFVCSNDKGK